MVDVEGIIKERGEKYYNFIDKESVYVYGNVGVIENGETKYFFGPNFMMYWGDYVRGISKVLPEIREAIEKQFIDGIPAGREIIGKDEYAHIRMYGDSTGGVIFTKPWKLSVDIMGKKFIEFGGMGYYHFEKDRTLKAFFEYDGKWETIVCEGKNNKRVKVKNFDLNGSKEENEKFVELVLNGKFDSWLKKVLNVPSNASISFDIEYNTRYGTYTGDFDYFGEKKAFRGRITIVSVSDPLIRLRGVPYKQGVFNVEGRKIDIENLDRKAEKAKTRMVFGLDGVEANGLRKVYYWNNMMNYEFDDRDVKIYIYSPNIFELSIYDKKTGGEIYGEVFKGEDGYMALYHALSDEWRSVII
jgi:hypothetical protein